jgi:rubredoxin
VKEKIVSHFAFGDPEEDEYAIGNVWATSNDSEGWRVVECPLKAHGISGQKSGDTDKFETAHVHWECPNCNQSFSEEYLESDVAPLLVKCGQIKGVRLQ